MKIINNKLIFCFCIYARSAGKTEADGVWKANDNNRANKNGMICYVRIKLTKNVVETAKTTKATATKNTTSPLPSKPTRTTTVPAQYQRKRKASSARRSPRKKKTINYVEDAAEDVQSSETEFRHTRALLSAAATHCHNAKSNVTVVDRSTEDVGKNAQTEMSSVSETSSLTADEICKKPETEAGSDLEIKGREVSYATSVLQHFIPCGEDVALHTHSSLLKSECPVHGSESVTDQTLLPLLPGEDTTSSCRTPTDIELKGHEYVGDYEGSLVVKESEEIRRRKNAETVRKIKGETDEMTVTNEGKKTKTQVLVAVN